MPHEILPPLILPALADPQTDLSLPQNPRDLAHFVNLFGYTPKEALLAATSLGGEIMGHPDELGKVQPGYYADVILVDGDPVKDIELLQHTDKIAAIVINGHVHKNTVG